MPSLTRGEGGLLARAGKTNGKSRSWGKRAREVPQGQFLRWGRNALLSNRGDVVGEGGLPLSSNTKVPGGLVKKGLQFVILAKRMGGGEGH